MKYKHIPSALHNFGHSFVSLNNYVDGECITDVLRQTINATGEHEVRIDFGTGAVVPELAASNPILIRSLKYWREWLPVLLTQHQVSPDAVVSVVLTYRLTQPGRAVSVEAVDDRGRLYKVFVTDTI